MSLSFVNLYPFLRNRICTYSYCSISLSFLYHVFCMKNWNRNTLLSAHHQNEQSACGRVSDCALSCCRTRFLSQ